MTEEEAKEKGCPKLSDRTRWVKCVASDCMMWEWDLEYDTSENGHLINRHDSSVAGSCGLVK